MKKKYWLFSFIIFFVFVVGYIVLNKEEDIEKVLTKESYVYLPEVAKNYIIGYYNETGTILKTERNKVINEPYLNPDYVKYLELGSEEVSDYIPADTLVDYDYSKVEVGGSLPSKYDSRNVNGISYVTSNKDQKSSSLCWDFSVTSVLESKILKAGLYNGRTELDLSERQIDYATTDPNSVVDIQFNPYFFDYQLDTLMGGGNSKRYFNAILNGISPTLESNFNVSFESKEKLTPSKIWNTDNVNYEVNGYYYFPMDISSNYPDISAVPTTDFINVIKNQIKDNGSVEISFPTSTYVSYIPSGGEKQLNSNSSYNTLYYRDITYKYPVDHSVAIIGWDDSYSHNVCVSGSGLLSKTNSSGKCSSGTLKTIKGAWIAKNTWEYSNYIYIAYESTYSTYTSIYDVSKKNYDNVYAAENNGMSYQVFDKLKTKERLNKVKVSVKSANTNLRVYYSNGEDGSFEYLGETKVTYPGLYTIDVSDKNIVLDQDKFRIKANILGEMSVTTSNVTNEPEIVMNDAQNIDSISIQKLVSESNVVILSGYSRNLASNDRIDFKVKTIGGTDVTSKFKFYRNYAVSNYINALVGFNEDVKLGSYVVSAYYKGKEYASFNLMISNYAEILEGDGTIESPYIITNARGLDMIRTNQFAYYKLGNDIDLTYDTQNKDGLFYNDGKGWEPIKYSSFSFISNIVNTSDGFSGGLDGDGHTIKGLYINRPSENVVGLFANTYNQNYSDVYIKNLTLSDVNITGNNFVGALLGHAWGGTYEKVLDISNVKVLNGIVNGNKYVGGIVGNIYAGSNLTLIDSEISRQKFDNLFNSSIVSGSDYVGGIAGLVMNLPYESKAPISFNNIENIGNVSSDYRGGGLFGYLSTNQENSISITNAIASGKINSYNCGKSSCLFDNASTGKLTFKNIYYTYNYGYMSNNESISYDNVGKKTIRELTNIDNYSSWNNFNDNWFMDSSEDISRIPVIKDTNFKYSYMGNINLNINTTNININKFLYPKLTLANNFIYEVKDETIASIDSNGLITPHKRGTTKVRILSYYDGYDKEINLTIVSNISYKVVFNANGGVGKVNTLVLKNDEYRPLSKNLYTKDNYVFIGWSKNPNATVAEYTDEELVGEMTEINNDVIELYAVWKYISYEVRFDANGADGEMPNQSFLLHEIKSLSKNLYTKEGYSFVGWNTSLNGNGKKYTDEEVVKNLATTNGTIVTLYAMWHADLLIDFKDYLYDIDYITNIPSNTKLSDYLNNLIKNDDVIIEVYSSKGSKLGLNDLITTNSVTKIYRDNNLEIEIVNVVPGDTNSDGRINIADVKKLADHTLKGNILNKYEIIAGEVTLDGRLNIADVKKLADYTIKGNMRLW